MRIYKEVTPDHGYEMRVNASNNFAAYILTSAIAHDMYNRYVDNYDRHPSAAWFNRNFNLERLK